jgi:hypothetical protein
LDTLLLWLLQLLMNPEQGNWMFQNQNKLGRPMMHEDPFDLDFVEIMKVIEDNVEISFKFAS